MTDVEGAAPARPQRSYMPSFRVLPEFLAPDEAARLLDYAEANAAAFKPTEVGARDKARIDPSLRVSSSLRGLGPTGPLLKGKLEDMAGDLTAALRMSPFTVSSVELQLVAHGDGAFYRRHIDTGTATDLSSIRVLSGVYYLHRAPKRFAGGALRLYAIGDADRFVDVEPLHNSLLVFPSWAPHEVMPVSCPSGAFMDSRFAVNCWLRMRRPRPNDPPAA
jgi:Rps23 Pro-64 3,4-dihydroxylase Tpa1-like proline 4-hydroxylase